jgi:hypothetical protein
MKNRLIFMLSILCILAIFAGLPRAHASSDVTIQNTSTFISSIGTLHVVGEVQNNGAHSLKYVEIVGTFYDQSHTMIGTDYTFTLLDTLMPGDKSPFDLLETDTALAAQIKSYSLTTTYLTTTPKPPGLEILSNSNSINTFGDYVVMGEVQNLKSQQTTYVEIIATFYNSTGAVVGCDYTYSNPSDLAANQTAPFKITFIYNEIVPSIDHYTLTCQSIEYSIVPEYPNLALPAILASVAIVTVAFKAAGARKKNVESSRFNYPVFMNLMA